MALGAKWCTLGAGGSGRGHWMGATCPFWASVLTIDGWALAAQSDNACRHACFSLAG